MNPGAQIGWERSRACSIGKSSKSLGSIFRGSVTSGVPERDPEFPASILRLLVRSTFRRVKRKSRSRSRPATMLPSSIPIPSGRLNVYGVSALNQASTTVQANAQKHSPVLLVDNP